MKLRLALGAASGGMLLSLVLVGMINQAVREYRTAVVPIAQAQQVSCTIINGVPQQDCLDQTPTPSPARIPTPVISLPSPTTPDSSDIPTPSETPVVADPVISPPGGSYNQPVQVTITSATTCAEIHYTIYDLEGEVTQSDQIYTDSFRLEDSAIVEAQAFCEGYEASQRVSATFIICYPDCFIIAVTGNRGQSIDAVYRATVGMVKTTQPWQYFSSKTSKILVVPFRNSQDLGCRTIEGAAGGNFPLCPNDAVIQQALAGAKWNAIVVVTGVDCNCGTVANLTSSTAAVGTRANASLIAHELGHATGKMVDEYYYKFGFEGGPLGPNCFESQSMCSEKTQQVQGAVCEVGCRSVKSWRPATQLMHNEIGRPYGPLETCIMAKKIMDVIGTKYQGQGGYPFGNCEAPQTPQQSDAPPPEPGQFYGGRR